MAAHSYAHYLSKELQKPEIERFAGLDFAGVNLRLRERKMFDDSVRRLAADWLGLPLGKAPDGAVEDALIEPLNMGLAKTALFMPLSSSGDVITAAIASPERGLPVADDYARMVGKRLRLVYLDEETLIGVIHKTWEARNTRAEDVVGDMESDGGEDALSRMAATEDLLDANDDAPIIRLINSIMAQAVKERASDIHIEPFEKQLNVRFRVDGVMHTVITPSMKLHPAVTARLKVMAGMDIAEKRMPQDGRFKIRMGGHEVDVRASVLPTAHGERVVLRLLQQQSGILTLNEIGMRPEQVTQMKNWLQHKDGILLVSGPTGAGKTSTLYAAITAINTPQINIMTIEDPIEYQVEGINQMQVNAKINLTFAEGLRNILRQNPNVIIVGETRDLETAQISVQSSLTGHLVLSTIHTNDSPSTVTRLVDMGIEPFLVGSTLRGVIAQRLLRTLYAPSRKPRELDAETKAMFQKHLPKKYLPKEITLFDAGPCDASPTGYTGRKGIYEMLSVTPALRRQIHDKANDSVLRATAQKDGMLTLFQEGLLMAARGETTLEEVFRVTMMDQIDA
ncbi:MAG: type II secretion system protein GspE [Proteobacteria bacterium]|nr:type II secretion system protein GspE [Pseudomonadota bacterium]